MFISADIISTL